MSSSIVVRVRYKQQKNTKTHIAKWVDYVSKKEKADSTSLDEKNIMNEYFSLFDKDSFLYEKCESFVWNKDGDVNPKKELKSIRKIDDYGFIWNLVISFPPNFALNKGLITKSDYSDLTKNIMPKLINDMGLRLDNTTWYASLHINTKNPHMHILIHEYKKTASRGYIAPSCIHNLKSNIANYLVNNNKFYVLRDKTFSNIVGEVSLKDLSKVKNQKLYSDKFRRELNNKLIDLYNVLPKVGRLQYNSKNMIPYKEQLNNIIEYILMHNSIKYDYAQYIKLLKEHQKELNTLYGLGSENKNQKYCNEQINRLYSKIGNEILSNFKKYQSMDKLAKEKQFLKKHINEFKFKSNSNYAKEETKINIAKQLYKLCMFSGLNYNETRKVFENWLENSKYNFNVDYLISLGATLDYDMSTTEYFNSLKKLGYNYERYNKIKSKEFYKELNYKKFINSAFNHLIYELKQEEKQIINELEYELEKV